MVRVPREVFEKWSTRPWSEMLAAAQDGVDGLAEESPSITPFSCITTEPRQSPDEGDKNYQKRLDGYHRTKDAAYFQETRSGWRLSPGAALLYQKSL